MIFKNVVTSLVFCAALLAFSLTGHAAGLGTGYNAPESPLTLGPNDREIMFETDPMYGVAYRKNKNTVRIVGVATTYLGANSSFRLGPDSNRFDLDYVKQYVQIDIKRNGKVRGYSKIYGYIDANDDGIVVEGEIPNTVGKPKGLLFKGRIRGFDEDISVGSNIIAAGTEKFKGWAAQFGTEEPLFLKFRDLFGNAKDWPGLDWFFQSNMRYRNYSFKHVDHHYYGSNTFRDRFGLGRDNNAFLFKATAIQVVPLAASLPLLLSGIVGLFAIGRRRISS